MFVLFNGPAGTENVLTQQQLFSLSIYKGCNIQVTYIQHLHSQSNVIWLFKYFNFFGCVLENRDFEYSILLLSFIPVLRPSK